MEPSKQHSPQQHIFDLKSELFKYIVHWRWFILTILLSLCIAYTILRYSIDKYEVSSNLLIKNEKNSQAPELKIFNEFTKSRMDDNINNQIQILSSRSLMTKVVKKLKLNINYYSKGRILLIEGYKQRSAIRFNLLGENKENTSINTEFSVSVQSPTQFILIDKNKQNLGTYEFGKKIAMPFGDMVITPNSKQLKNQEILIKINPIEKSVQKYRKALRIRSAQKNSGLLHLSITDVIPERAYDILNTLIEFYELNTITDKSEIALKTTKFINERLEIIQNDLLEFEKSITDIKRGIGYDVAINTGVFSEKIASGKNKIFEINTQIRLLTFIENYVQEQGNSYKLIPEDLGISDFSVNSATSQINQLILERNRLLKTSSVLNPIIVNIDTQLEAIIETLYKSLENLKKSYGIRISRIRKQENTYTSKLAEIPSKEQALKTFEHQIAIKENLYTFLLQKREENAISLAVTISNSKIIDPPYITNSSSKGKKSKAYLLALFIGFIVPIGVIFSIDLLDTKIHSKKDIEDRLNMPIIGEIPFVKSKEKLIANSKSHSGISEAFRLVRTNLDFILGNIKTQNGKSIFITSTISGEGKSFIALNLATILAYSNNKVLLVGMDLRAPKLKNYMNVEVNNKGITEYILDHTLTIDDLKFKPFENLSLDVLSSGAIPPNPSELLLNERVSTLLSNAKNAYDYVIVDTAPVNMVTDTLLLEKYADMFIYVVRANYIDKKMLEIPEKMHNDKRLPNIALLLNATQIRKGYGYGYGNNYGYGYGYSKSKPKSMVKKIFSLASRN